MDSGQTSSTVHYRDRWLILLAVPLINFLNYYLTYPSIQPDGFFFLTFTIDTLTGYASWYALRSVIVWLDTRYPYEKGMLRRLVFQVPAATAAFLLVIVGTTEGVNAIARDTPVPASFYAFDLFIFLIWGLFLNVLYLCLYLVGKLRAAPQASPADDGRVWVKIGKQQIAIDLAAAQCFYVDHECVYAVSAGDKQVVSGYTLDKLEKRLDASRFFRANRQFLITRDIINSLKREDNGKLSVWLLPHRDLPESIMVSRLRAGALRQWLEG